MSKETFVTDGEADLDFAAAKEAVDAASAVDGDFGAEFRELARQRRFQRNEDSATKPSSDAATGPRSQMAILDQAAERMARANRAHTQSATNAAPAATQPVATPAQTAERIVQQSETAHGKTHLSDENAAMLAALTRATERYVDVRAELAAATEKLSTSQAEITALNNRLMAARALVLDAQNAMQETNERCAWLEGRNEMLQDALELAVHASLAQRWKWRREAKKRTKHSENEN